MPTVVRTAAGLVFVLFGLGKFFAHAEETHAFERYGLPAPEAFVYLVGSVEVLGGVLLIAGLLIRPAALALAATMVGAIVVSGIGEGEVVPSLTLAPLLLVAMLYLLWVGRGEPLLSRRPAPR